MIKGIIDRFRKKPTTETTMQPPPEEGYLLSWNGPRKPSRIFIPNVVNTEIGYMANGLVRSMVDGKYQGPIIGTYERVVDYQEQSDGTRLNTIRFQPVTTQEDLARVLGKVDTARVTERLESGLSKLNQIEEL